MRDSPCVEPRSCGGEKRSNATTSAPLLESRHEAAAPMAPQPTTATLISRLLGRDFGDRLAHRHLLALFHQKLRDGPGNCRGDLRVDLVGARFDDGLALVYVVARSLDPGAYHDLLGALEVG